MPDEKLITMEPVAIAAHSGGSACANVTYQGSALIDARGKVQLSENGIKIFREVIENPEVKKLYPNLKNACVNFLTSKEVQALIVVDWILSKIAQSGLPDFLLPLWDFLQKGIF